MSIEVVGTSAFGPVDSLNAETTETNQMVAFEFLNATIAFTSFVA